MTFPNVFCRSQFKTNWNFPAPEKLLVATLIPTI